MKVEAYILTEVAINHKGELVSEKPILGVFGGINGIAIAADNHAYLAVITEKQAK